MHMMRGVSRLLRMIFGTGLVVGAALAEADDRPVPGAVQADLTTRLIALGATPCAASSLLCLDLPVPRDHFDSAAGDRIEISFAVATAPFESTGLLLFIEGGPGVSGLVHADDTLEDFLPRGLTNALDVIVFDHRGVDPDHGISCPRAEAGAGIDAAATEGRAPLERDIAAARAYVGACIGEMASPALLPFLSTRQAVHDIEAMRQAIGAPQLWIMGVSYGTRLAQAYALEYPQAVRGLILDGVLDTTLSLEGWIGHSSVASEAVLEEVLAACDALPDCAVDMEPRPGKCFTPCFRGCGRRGRGCRPAPPVATTRTGRSTGRCSPSPPSSPSTPRRRAGTGSVPWPRRDRATSGRCCASPTGSTPPTPRRSRAVPNRDGTRPPRRRSPASTRDRTPSSALPRRAPVWRPPRRPARTRHAG
jgi:pimeloyl-ACP methyl ester carboxylesterase